MKDKFFPKKALIAFLVIALIFLPYSGFIFIEKMRGN